MSDSDVSIVGGGIVGLSVAFGLLRQGLRVTVFDGNDRDFRASRGNFGLVWVQGKGDTLLEYARWSQLSASLWPEFAKSLNDQTGIDIQLSQPGGLFICLNEKELEQRSRMLSSMQAQLQDDYPFDVLSNNALRKLVPEVGQTVAGATYSPLDGHINPLHLLRALYQLFSQMGGHLKNGISIDSIKQSGGSFELVSGKRKWESGKVVLAAGLGNRNLGEQLGLTVPVMPNRGQVLISERVDLFLKYPTGHVRQTGDGTIQLGDSKEDVGFDDGTTVDVMSAIASRAVTMFPRLANLRMIRAWSALRVMTSDGYPIYQESSACPGAYVVTCHSGVTLAAIHAGLLADWIAGRDRPAMLDVFSGDRFHV